MAKRFNENKIRYYEEVCNIEKMLEDKKSLKEIYNYMKDLVKYTYEDELNYISLPRKLEEAFEFGKQDKMNIELIPEFVKLTIKRTYNRELTERQGFSHIYGMLTAVFDKEKINQKINKSYKYTRDYVNF